MSRENYELTGQKIQGYTISKPIGQGKFSIVYRAENEQGVPAALKKIKIFDMADQKQREKCLREVDIMKKLSHPHIIQYIDSFIHNNELIIVTEWAEKGDLKKLIKEKEAEDLQFDQRNIWDFMRQIASALCHMHEKRIMHRDLKPANIFIGADGKLKVGDLGLGRSFSSETLEAYSKVGTPLYMSPQLIQDEGYTENADVWSLGCICYELAELKSPFRNKEEKMSLMDLFDNITKCNYRPIDAHYSPQLREAIRSMIVVDPAKRWGSEQVHTYALKCLEQVRKPLLDPIIAMDDIAVKLTLLHYESNFCKAAERKPIHKLYFALPDQKAKDNSQLYYFLELAYWIMALSKADHKKRDRLALISKTQIDWNSPEASCAKFLADLEDYGVKADSSITADRLLDGHGEAVCYLLNQLLTRELVRMKFEFKPPAEADPRGKTADDFEEDKAQGEVDEEERSMGEESLEEQSQFEQSILFNRHNRKGGNVDGALIEKIEELEEEENRMMIVGRIDEQEWRAECLRLEKKLGDISSGAKQYRKRHGYTHVETTKVCSAKMIDLTKYLRHNGPIISNSVEKDLEKIQKGERRLNEFFPDAASNYSVKNKQTAELNDRVAMLGDSLKEVANSLEKTEERLQEMKEKIRLATADNENSRVGELKAAVARLRRQILDMDQQKEIISWELRRLIMRQKNRGKDDYLEISYMEQL